MASPLVFFTSTLLLASAVRGSPFPQTVVGFGDTASICGVKYDDPKMAWANSGASYFLNKWLNENKEDNWVNRIDQTTTADGSQGTSNLNCVDFSAGNCQFPTVQCKFFTPPALYHVRNAISTAYSMIRALHEGLQNNVIKETLNVGTIVSDFGPPAAGSGLFGALNGAFTIGAGLAAAAPIVAGPLTIIAGVFGILASTPPETIDPTLDIETQLSKAFDATEKQLETLTHTIFGGSGDTSKLPGAGGDAGPNGETNNIAKFFANGKFLVAVTGTGAVDALINPIIQKGSEQLRQRLVNTALKAQNYYVFVDQDRNQADCNKITGSRWIDNQCFTIEKFGLPARGNQGVRGTTKGIDKNMILKFDDPNAGYNINVEEFYRNADACQNAHTDFKGDIDPNNLPTDGSRPQCFFNLPVVKAKASPCLADNVNDLPDNLGFSTGACEIPETCPGHPPRCI